MKKMIIVLEKSYTFATIKFNINLIFQVMSSATLYKELNNLDFSTYIGGPLQAAIKAQTDASIASADFIQRIGFTESGDLRYITFKYQKTVPDESLSSTTGVKQVGYELEVPFLTILTIPAIRIEEITIDFSAKLNSCDTSKTDTEWGIDASLGVNWGVVNFKASTSYKRKTTTGSEVTRAYDLTVHVKAVNDELPAGLDRILRIMENEIKDKPATNNNNNNSGSGTGAGS